MIYAISTELAAPERTEAAIGDWIRANYASWTHPIANFWVVEGPLVADQIYTALEPMLAPDDRLVIIKGGTEALWRGISDASARWLADVFPGSLSERIPGKTEGLTS